MTEKLRLLLRFEENREEVERKVRGVEEFLGSQLASGEDITSEKEALMFVATNIIKVEREDCPRCGFQKSVVVGWEDNIAGSVGYYKECVRCGYSDSAHGPA